MTSKDGTGAKEGLEKHKPASENASPAAQPEASVEPQLDASLTEDAALSLLTIPVFSGFRFTAQAHEADLRAADRLKDVHLAGGVLDLYESDGTFIQALLARAWNVTDGFNGTMVLPNNPLTGEAISAPVVMRYTPSANLGAINLYGVVAQKKLKQFDVYGSANWSSLRPNDLTTPFGGLGSDPFSTPENHEGQMYYLGVRYKIPQDDGRTKIGFEFNHGTKYWFNFSRAEDDIVAPKTNTRGSVYETS
jgi:hypothetical protein